MRKLIALGVAMLAILAVYLALRPTSEPPPLPDDPLALARRLRAHPADWRAAAALNERALDSRLPNRVALWRAAHAAAIHLAPTRQATSMELVRSSLFHWQELSPADRRAAIDTVAPLLRDSPTFLRMARPLFELTGDFGLLRRWNPGTEQALVIVRDTAATFGHFQDYRELRREVTRKRFADFHARLHQLSPAEIINEIPQPPYTTDDEPLLREALAELHRRPLTEDPRRGFVVDALVDYALRHRLEPLDGIDSVVRIPGSASDTTRYRLAEALHMEAAAYDIRISAKEPLTETPGKWHGVDTGDTLSERAWVDREMSGPASITIERVKSDEVPPYVEIYLDDARIGEGEVTAQRTFAIPSTKGLHRVVVRLADGRTRNNERRVVRIVSLAP